MYESNLIISGESYFVEREKNVETRKMSKPENVETRKKNLSLFSVSTFSGFAIFSFCRHFLYRDFRVSTFFGFRHFSLFGHLHYFLFNSLPANQKQTHRASPIRSSARMILVFHPIGRRLLSIIWRELLYNSVLCLLKMDSLTQKRIILIYPVFHGILIIRLR